MLRHFQTLSSKSKEMTTANEKVALKQISLLYSTLPLRIAFQFNSPQVGLVKHGVSA